MTASLNNPKGSLWHRWDSHIHTPDTLLNDQYTGPDAWNDFLTRIEQSQPRIRALGITDYFTLENYEKVVVFKKQGRLPEVDLIFANVELRLIIGTAKGMAINAHLLISPETADHVLEAKSFLQKLEFSDGVERYNCNPDDLRKLGHAHDNTIKDERKAMEAGACQFKINPDQLDTAMKNSAWAKANILFAIAVSSNDGTSGLSTDHSFTTTRRTLERSADIILSGQPGHRNFWLGQSTDSIDQIIEKYGSAKPCIHGSDAHKSDDVGRPVQDRFTWIKGDLTFESLRQICIEPGDRVLVAPNPPLGAIDSSVLDEITVNGANWLHPSFFPINRGLVAIIGARGSGKTALADLIAVGGNISEEQVANNSFLSRAAEYLQGVEATAKWKSGEVISNQVSSLSSNGIFNDLRVQYLSQQFVDKLCSSEGLTDQLMQEIERVIFISHDPKFRIGFSDFSDMLTSQSSVFRSAKQDEKDNLASISEQLTQERVKLNSLPSLQKSKTEKEAVVTLDKANRSKLINLLQAQRAADLEKIEKVLETVTAKLDTLKKKKRSVELLKQHIDNTIKTTLPGFTEKLKTTYQETGFTTVEWSKFDLKFERNINDLLKEKITDVEQEIASLQGRANHLTQPELSGPTLIPAGQTAAQQTFTLLSNESQRLKHLIGIDQENGRQYNRLTEKINKELAGIEELKMDIADCDGAQVRINTLLADREETYRSVFEAIISEETTLKILYEPLRVNLEAQSGSLNKFDLSGAAYG